MTDLDAQLDRALEHLRLLAATRTDVLGEYHPRAQTFGEGVAGHRPARLPVRLDPDGHPTSMPLDEPWRQAMRDLAAAFAPISEADCVQRLLGGEGDNVAQASVGPDVTDERANAARLRLALAVTHRLHDAWHSGEMSWQDTVWARLWCDALATAASRLPAYLRLPGGRCARCGRQSGALLLCPSCRAEDAARHGRCRNPDLRPECRVLVVNHKRGLCRSCDQARRDRLRPSLTGEPHSGSLWSDGADKPCPDTEVTGGFGHCQACGRRHEHGDCEAA